MSERCSKCGAPVIFGRAIYRSVSGGETLSTQPWDYEVRFDPRRDTAMSQRWLDLVTDAELFAVWRAGMNSPHDTEFSIIQSLRAALLPLVSRGAETLPLAPRGPGGFPGGGAQGED